MEQGLPHEAAFGENPARQAVVQVLVLGPVALASDAGATRLPPSGHLRALQGRALDRERASRRVGR